MQDLTLRRGASGRMRITAAVVLLAWAAAACSSRPSAPAASSAIKLEMSTGSATVVGGGATINVSGDATVAVGYRISVEPKGLAVLHLGAGRTFELAGGEFLITGADRLQLVQGDVLGQLTSHAEVDGDGLTVTSDSGTFRVDAGAGSRLAVYDGSATMAIPGGSLNVPAFRQVSYTTGSLPQSPSPLEYAGSGDEWDHRYLQDALDLDSRLGSFGPGLDAQLGNASGATFFRIVIPDTAQVAYMAPFYSEPRSDVLIGYVIASRAAAAKGADVANTFATVMSLWKGGESWGVIAKELQVSADDIFAGLEDAIHRAGITAANPTPRFLPAPSPSPTVTTPSKPTQGPTVVPSPSVAPAPTPSPSGLLPTVLAPVTQILNGLLGLLFPQPTQTVTPGG